MEARKEVGSFRTGEMSLAREPGDCRTTGRPPRRQPWPARPVVPPVAVLNSTPGIEKSGLDAATMRLRIRHRHFRACREARGPARRLRACRVGAEPRRRGRTPGQAQHPLRRGRVGGGLGGLPPPAGVPYSIRSYVRSVLRRSSVFLVPRTQESPPRGHLQGPDVSLVDGECRASTQTTRVWRSLRRLRPGSTRRSGTAVARTLRLGGERTDRPRPLSSQ